MEYTVHVWCNLCQEPRLVVEMFRSEHEWAAFANRLVILSRAISRLLLLLLSYFPEPQDIRIRLGLG
jgi:hypothetical protein